MKNKITDNRKLFGTRTMPRAIATKNRRHYSNTTITACTVILLNLLVISISYIWESPILVIVSLLLYLWHISRIAKNHPYSFILALNYLFTTISVMISGYLIESGALLPEISVSGYSTGGFARICQYYIMFSSVVTYLTDKSSRLYWKKTPEPLKLFQKTRPIWMIAIIFACLASIAAMITFGVLNGFPLLQNIDRFDYRSAHSGNYLFQLFFPNRPIMAILLGLVYIDEKVKADKFALIVYVLLVITSFLFGEKFISVIYMTIFFMFPILLKQAANYPFRNISSTFKRFFWFIALLPVCLIVVLSIYSSMNAGKKDSNQAVVTRIASQGQLWFSVDRDTTDLFRLDVPSLTQDWRTLQGDNSPTTLRTVTEAPYSGMYNLMSRYMDRKLLSEYRQRGISLIVGLEAYLLQTFGWLGMLLPLSLIAAVYSSALNYLSKSVHDIDPIKIIIASKILISCDVGLQMGDLTNIFGVTLIKFAVLAGFYGLLLRFVNKRGTPATNS